MDLRDQDYYNEKRERLMNKQKASLDVHRHRHERRGHDHMQNPYDRGGRQQPWQSRPYRHWLWCEIQKLLAACHHWSNYNFHFFTVRSKILHLKIDVTKYIYNFHIKTFICFLWYSKSRNICLWLNFMYTCIIF